MYQDYYIAKGIQDYSNANWLSRSTDFYKAEEQLSPLTEEFLERRYLPVLRMIKYGMQGRIDQTIDLKPTIMVLVGQDLRFPWDDMANDIVEEFNGTEVPGIQDLDIFVELLPSKVVLC